MRNVAVVVGCGSIAFFVLFVWTWWLPLAVACVAVGSFVGLSLARPRDAALAGAVAGLVGSAAVALTHARGVPRSFAAGSVAAAEFMPTTRELLTSLGEHGPVATVALLGVVGTIIVGAGATALVAWAVSRTLSTPERTTERRRKAATVLLAVLLCASFVATGLSVSQDVITAANRPLKPGSYAYDAFVYLRAFDIMRDGTGYYEALVEAAAGDSRVMADGSVKDGVFRSQGWLWGPSAMRRPTIFYVWHLLARDGGSIVVLAVMACALALGSIAWGLAPYLAHRSLFVTIATMPYALFITLGRNIFFPDYWCALIVVIALMLVCRRAWIPAALTLLFAALVRETVGPSLGIVALSLAGVWWFTGRGREWLVRAGAFAAAAVAWLGFERVHEAIGARYVAFKPLSSLQLLGITSTTRPFETRVLRPTTYLLPGGAIPLRGVALMAAAPLGFWAVLASDRRVRAVVVSYTAFWLAFILTVGAVSEYWGQVLLLPACIGVACLIACADRLDRRLEMREPVPWS